MNKIIFHLHQYKTGGKTLEGILYRQYISKLLYINNLKPISGNDLVSNRIENLKNKKVFIDYKAVTGHMFFGAHRCFKDKECHYITILRYPITRAISYYYYMVNSSHTDEITKYILANKISLDNFLTISKEEIYNFKLSLKSKEELEMILSNGQAKFIAGMEYISSDNLYDIAKANISNFFIHVGVTEKFEKSLVILAEKIALKSRYFYFDSNVGNYSINQGAYNNEISKNSIRIFNNNNLVDRKIHYEAMNYIDNEIESNKVYYQKKINKLNNKNSIQKIIRPAIIFLKKLIYNK